MLPSIHHVPWHANKIMTHEHTPRESRSLAKHHRTTAPDARQFPTTTAGPFLRWEKIEDARTPASCAPQMLPAGGWG